MSSKENNSALDTCKLGSIKPFPPSLVESDSSENRNIFIDELKAEETAGGHDNLPLEKHYENLWVEVENMELKPSIRIVTDQLSEKFEELLQPLSVERKAAAESISAGEDLSDEDVEVETRSKDDFSTSMRSESKPKDSTDKLVYKDGLQVQDHPTSMSVWHQDLGPVTKEEQRASSSHIIEQEEDSRPGVSGVTKTYVDVNCKHNIANANKTTGSQTNKAPNDLEECTRALPPLLNRNPTSVSRISDEELEEDVQRFKHEVGKLKAAFQDREKEHPHLQKEVEDECIDWLTVSAFY